MILNPYRFGGGGPPSVSVPTANAILNFNGVDGSTSPIVDDAGVHAWTMTSAGGGAIDTSKSKFGPSSFQILSNDRVTAPSHADWAFGTGDFTVAGWVWVPSALSGGTVVWFMSNTVNGCAIHIRVGKLTLGREGVAYDIQSGNNIPFDQWVHLEVTRSAGTAYGFINGALEFSGASAHNFQQGIASFGAKSGGSESINSGWLDSCLVDKGTALHTSAFTPPTGPYSL